MKTIEIEGKIFELCGVVDSERAVKRIMGNSGRTVADCYERPSEVKKSIERDWRRWFADSPALRHMGVESYNCMMFTLTGVYRIEMMDEEYLLYITPAHNRAYRIIFD